MGSVADPDRRGFRFSRFGNHRDYRGCSGGAEVTRVTKVALTGPERSARKMLASIVKFLQVEDEESVDLWAILTALRGPDSGDYAVKQATTARLRHVIGLREYNSDSFLRYFTTSPEPLMKCQHGDGKSVHFVSHFNHAVETLLEFNRQEQKEVNAKLDHLTRQFNGAGFIGDDFRYKS